MCHGIPAIRCGSAGNRHSGVERDDLDHRAAGRWRRTKVQPVAANDSRGSADCRTLGGDAGDGDSAQDEGDERDWCISEWSVQDTPSLALSFWGWVATVKSPA